MTRSSWCFQRSFLDWKRHEATDVHDDHGEHVIKISILKLEIKLPETKIVSIP